MKKLGKRLNKTVDANVLDAFSGAATGITGSSVTCVWGPPDGTAATNLWDRRVVLPYQKSMSSDKYLKLRGYVMHEELHVEYTDPADWEEAVNDGIHQVLNTLEDGRINNLGRTGNATCDPSTFNEAVDHTWREIINTVLNPMAKTGKPAAGDMKNQIVNAVHAKLQDLYRLGLDPNIYCDAANRAAEHWLAQHGQTVFDVQSSSRDMLTLARKLIQYAEEEKANNPPPPPPSNPPPSGDGGQPNPDGSAQDAPDGSAQDAPDGSAPDAPDSPDQPNTGTSSDGGGAGKEEGDTAGDLNKAWGSAAESTDAKEAYDAYKDSPERRVSETPKLSRHKANQSPLSVMPASVVIRSKCNRVGSLLRSALVQASRTRTLRNQDDGDLDEDKLAEIADGRQSEDPFILKRLPKRDTDTAICLIGDGSCSMDDTLVQLGSGALENYEAWADVPKEVLDIVKPGSTVTTLALAQNAVLAGIHDMLRGAKITHEISIFLNYSLRVFKSYDQQRMSDAQLATLMVPYANGGTPMGRAMKTAADVLLRRPETRKVMLIISDGAPDDQRQTNAVATVLRKMGVEVYGFGIGSDTLTHCIPDPERCVSVCVDPLELPTKLASLVRLIAARQG